MVIEMCVVSRYELIPTSFLPIVTYFCHLIVASVLIMGDFSSTKHHTPSEQPKLEIAKRKTNVRTMGGADRVEILIKGIYSETFWSCSFIPHRDFDFLTFDVAMATV